MEIKLPEALPDPAATFVIRDNGIGMDFSECQSLYLAVGRNRRGEKTEERTAGGRPVLGRKGIGKFAGFGIASLVTVATVSRASGERTVFRLDLDALRADDNPSVSQKEIDVVEYGPPDEGRKDQHGTSITLSKLTIYRAPSGNQFRTSMAIPAVGAAGAAAVNSIFVSHFQDMAHGHFVIRGLERHYDPELIETEYRRLKL